MVTVHFVIPAQGNGMLLETEISGDLLRIGEAQGWIER